MLNNLSIKKRLYLMSFLLQLLAVVLAVQGLLMAEKNNVAIKDLYQNRAIPLSQLGELERRVAENRAMVNGVLLHPDEREKYVQIIEDNLMDSKDIWAAYMATSLTPEEKVLAAKVAEARGRYLNEGVIPAKEAMKVSDFAQVRLILDEKLRPLYPAVQTSMLELIQLQVHLAKQLYDDNELSHDSQACFRKQAMPSNEPAAV